MDVPCLLCGFQPLTSGFAVTGDQKEGKYFGSCPRCKTGHILPVRTAEESVEAHEELLHGELASKFSRGWATSVLDVFRWYRARTIHRRVSQNAYILDYGCGNGRMLFHLSRMGNYSLFGTELPGQQAVVAAATSGATVYTNGIPPDSPLFGNTDYISMFHVLEHLPNPSEVLDEMHQMLKPGGIILIALPNIRSVQFKLFRSDWLHLDPDRHISFPMANQLRIWFETKGYTLLRHHTLSLEQNPFGMVQSILNRISRQRDLLFHAFKGTANIRQKPVLLLHWLLLVTTLPLFSIADRILNIFRLGATTTLVFRKAQP